MLKTFYLLINHMSPKYKTKVFQTIFKQAQEAHENSLIIQIELNNKLQFLRVNFCNHTKLLFIRTPLTVEVNITISKEEVFFHLCKSPFSL